MESTDRGRRRTVREDAFKQRRLRASRACRAEKPARIQRIAAGAERRGRRRCEIVGQLPKWCHHTPEQESTVDCGATGSRATAENQDGRRPGRGWEWRMREWPSRSNEKRARIELVDAFKPQSSATGNEETGDVAAISSASNMAAVADMKHGKSGQGRSKDLIMAALIDQPPVGHECRDQGFLKHVLTESGGNLAEGVTDMTFDGGKQREKGNGRGTQVASRWSGGHNHGRSPCQLRRHWFFDQSCDQSFETKNPQSVHRVRTAGNLHSVSILLSL